MRTAVKRPYRLYTLTVCLSTSEHAPRMNVSQPSCSICTDLSESRVCNTALSQCTAWTFHVYTCREVPSTLLSLLRLQVFMGHFYPPILVPFHNVLYWHGVNMMLKKQVKGHATCVCVCVCEGAPGKVIGGDVLFSTVYVVCNMPHGPCRVVWLFFCKFPSLRFLALSR